MLGAGFSYSVSDEFPLTRDLLERLFDEDAELRKQWNSLASYFKPFLNTRKKLKEPQIIGGLTVLEAYRAIVGKQGEADQMIRELQTRVLYAAATLLHRISANASNSSIARSFVKCLRPEQDAILTLNWDVFLENALLSEGIPFQFDVLPAAAATERPDGLLVLKPQGSVTWYRINPVGARAPGAHSESVLFVRPPPPASHWTLSYRPNPPTRFSSPGLLPADPAIITPGFIGEDRARELDWSGYLLRIATYAAISASKIVVIGYSLPPDDFHILAALSFGIPQDSGDGVEIFVVDPSKETFKQWHSAFNQTTVLSGKPVIVHHWARNLQEALTKKDGPWK